MNNFSYEYTPAESSKGGTLLCIDKNLTLSLICGANQWTGVHMITASVMKGLRYRSRNDPTLYKSKETKSSSIEILDSKKKNTILGCIYKHPNVSVGEFTNDFLEPLLKKLY